jgi:hypothetical protein
MNLSLRPVNFDVACAFVRNKHRHHLPPLSHKFSIGLEDDGELVAVVITGRPVARAFDDGWTLEVLRLCTDDTPHAASKLYAAAWRAARAMGYRRLITYTLAEEPGTSLRAAGWKELYTTKDRPGGWDAPSRPRDVKAPTGPKTLWEASA